MTDTTIVKFLQPCQLPTGAFAGGEVAGFERELANDLIERGVAELHDAGAGAGVPLPSPPGAPEPWRTDPSFAAVLADEAKGERP